MGSSKARLLAAVLLLLHAASGAPSASAQSQDNDVVSLVLDTTEVIQDLDPVYTTEQVTSTKTPVRPSKGDRPLICSACERFANDAVGYLSDKRTQDKVLEILHGACSQTFSLQQQCVELMDSYATLVFAKITEIEPEQLCKRYGMCSRETALVFSAGAASDGTCAFCRHLLDELVSKLKDPDAEFEVIQILLKECNKIEGHVQQCKRLVLQYVPLILVNGEKFLEKNDVCALVQACDAGPNKRAVVGSSDSEAGLLSAA